MIFKIFQDFSHMYFGTLAYFIYSITQIGLIYSSSFLALVVTYGALGVGDGVYFASLTAIACEAAGSANLANQAIGYYHTLIAFSVIIGEHEPHRGLKSFEIIRTNPFIF
jgi:hypothetical protein